MLVYSNLYLPNNHKKFIKAHGLTLQFFKPFVNVTESTSMKKRSVEENEGFGRFWGNKKFTYLYWACSNKHSDTTTNNMTLRARKGNT